MVRLAKITYSEKFFEKEFVDKSLKEAYLKAVKWYSTNILAKSDMFEDVQVKFTKCTKVKPTIIVTLYATLNSKDDILQEHCKCCRDMHHTFFINEDTHCDRCSALALNKRIELKSKVKKKYYKELLEKRLEQLEINKTSKSEIKSKIKMEDEEND